MGRNLHHVARRATANCVTVRAPPGKDEMVMHSYYITCEAQSAEYCCAMRFLFCSLWWC